MNATVEIDKAGRIVVPKKMRDALHLVGGTRMSIRRQDNTLVIEQETKGRGLYRKNGMLVYDPGPNFPYNPVDPVADAREDRLRHVLSFGEEE